MVADNRVAYTLAVNGVCSIQLNLQPRQEGRKLLRATGVYRKVVCFLLPCIGFLCFPQEGEVHGQEVVLRADFEQDAIGETPRDWTLFAPERPASVTVLDVGGRRCVQGRRSSPGGLVALSRNLPSVQERVQVEFSFAFGRAAGRTLNIWSHEPNGRDASQLNLCIQPGGLQQFDGRSRTWEVITRRVKASEDIGHPIWHRLRVLVDARQGGIDYWVSEPGSEELPKAPTATMHAYRTDLPIAAIDLVSGQRIDANGWYLIDDMVVLGGKDLPKPGKVAPLPKPWRLWAGPPIPGDVNLIPFVSGVEHRTIHQATDDTDKFLHGAAIVESDGVVYANWANSPTNENGPHETLRGRRSLDGGRTWSDLEIIGPGFPDSQRHSHGVLFEYNKQVWTICSRFGGEGRGRRFPGLCGEAFVLDKQSDRWESRGIVMRNCWPYDQPIRMDNGRFITGGQDRDGLPVVAISRPDDLLHWDTVSIPFPPRLAPSFAETTVQADESGVLAVIRGGRGVAWVSHSDDFGKTWSRAIESNLPMPRAKAYLGRLSTGQLYLLSNLRNRDTLVVSVGKPGEMQLRRMWRVRHGRSGPPRYPGRAKGKQWSYPYGYEHDGQLYVVYSVGKEDCGLSVVPIKSLVLE